MANRRNSTSIPFRSHFSRPVRSTTVAALTMALSSTLTAQEVKAQEVEEVIVTGMRESLRTSVEVKRNTMEIVDSITAEDIGKLPDPNVAETLTRIPGVQGYRYGGEGASPVGEGSGITIRGLTGQTASRVDGRAYFTAGGREFNIESAIPGMISGIDVYKNPTAEHIEGGIGGLINLRTRKPLDFTDLTLSTAVSVRYNDVSEQTSPEGFGLFADRWTVGEGEMGFLIAANYQESDNRSDSNPGSRGPQTRRAVRADSPEFATLAGANQAYAGRDDVWFLADVPNCLDGIDAPTGTSYTDDVACRPLSYREDLITAITQEKHVFQEDIHRVRRGASAAFQWRLNEDLEFYAQGNYNYYLYDQSYRFMFLSDNRNVQNLVTAPYAFDEDFMNRNSNGAGNELVSGHRVVSGTFLDSGMSLMGGAEHRPYESWLGAVGANWQATDALQARFDFSYIKADQTHDNRSVRAVPRTGLAWDITRNLTSEPNGLAISGPSLSDPDNFVYSDYGNGSNRVYDDDGYDARIDLRYELETPFLSAVKGGVRYARQNARYSDFGFGGRALTTDGQRLAADQSNAISLASTGMLESAPSNWLDGAAGYSGGYVVYDPDALWGDGVLNTFPNANIPREGAIPENLTSRRYSVEKSYAGYVMGEFAYEDLIKGNIGVRVVKTDLSARAMVQSFVGTAPGPIVPNTESNSYTDVLPSLNITGYLTPDMLLRFGYAKGITRPSLGDLNPTLAIDRNNGTVIAGNPDLKPLEAESFDLSLEKYFSDISYVSLGVFYKDIEGFPFGRQECRTIPFAPPSPASGPCGAGPYQVTVRDNAEKGSAQGVEFAFQTFFDFLPGIWQNFGAAGSYTRLDTENPVLMNGGTVETPMPFQSDSNWSLSGLFENELMSARVVYTYRDDFVLFGIDAWPSWGRYVKGYGILDASVNFNLPHDLTLSLNASNLTDQGPDRYVGEPGGYASSFEQQHFVNGRVYGIGIRHNFGR